MGKNQAASGLTNIIQYDNRGNITFVSGSTTLMSVSSSGAITTTGTISGSSVQSASLAQNSNLLQGTGSVGFATTGSFATTSGSVSTRITQIEAVYATTGSNSFRATQSITGSLTVTGQIIAQTLNVQQVTSSIVFSTGSNVFGCDLNSRQTFTGSVLITGSLVVNTTGPELQVNNNGVILGNLTTDRHGVTGSFYQTGSIAFFAGSVGIGVVNPGLALDVNGYAKVTGIGLNSSPSSIGANPNYIRLTNTGGDLYIGQEGSTNGAFFNGSLAYNSVLYSGRPYNFIIDGVSRMYINSSGNVGVGNTNPAYRLDIQSGSDFDIRLRDTSLGGTVGIVFETANDFSGTSQAYIKGVGAGNSGVSQLIFGTAGASGDTTATERMRITSVGNVGIGACSPSSILEIQKDTNGDTPINFINGSGGSGNTNASITLDFKLRNGSGGSTGGVLLRVGKETDHIGTNVNDYFAISTTKSDVMNEKIRLTAGGTLFYKGYFANNLMGGFSVIGTLSAINTGDRYLHARINTIGSMMYWIKVFGYSYIAGIIEGLGGGYIGGGTGGVNQGALNGSIVAMYQNNGFLEVVVDTINTATTNRWGSITFLGGTDSITTVQPLEIIAYSWASTTTRVY